MYTVEYDLHATRHRGQRIFALVDPDGIDVARTDVALPTIPAALLGYDVTVEHYPTHTDLRTLGTMLNDARAKAFA